MPRYTTAELENLSRKQLEEEVVRCRAALRDGTKAERLTVALERVARLEVRDKDRSQELRRTQAELRVAIRAADREKELRIQAEREKDKMHALLIQERVRKVPTRGLS